MDAIFVDANVVGAEVSLEAFNVVLLDGLPECSLFGDDRALNGFLAHLRFGAVRVSGVLVLRALREAERGQRQQQRSNGNKSSFHDDPPLGNQGCRSGESAFETSTLPLPL